MGPPQPCGGCKAVTSSAVLCQNGLWLCLLLSLLETISGTKAYLFCLSVPSASDPTNFPVPLHEEEWSSAASFPPARPCKQKDKSFTFASCPHGLSLPYSGYPCIETFALPSSFEGLFFETPTRVPDVLVCLGNFSHPATSEPP